MWLLDKMGNPSGFNINELQRYKTVIKETRHFKLMMEAAGFSVVGDMMGYLWLRNLIHLMTWFQAKNQDAKEFLDYLKLSMTLSLEIESSQYRQMAEEATCCKSSKKI